MKTADEVPNWSGLSNVPNATTLNANQNPTGCIPCAYCKRFEKWKVVCTMIQQFCASNNIQSAFCTGQKQRCEKKVDSLIARCRAISCEASCT